MENIAVISPEVSIVVPFFNEELMADLAIRKISEVMINVDRTYEIIAVDDGSTDNTIKILENLNNTIKTKRLLNKELFNRVKSVYNTSSELDLNTEQLRLISDV